MGFAGILYGSAPDTADAIMPHIVLTAGLPTLVVGLFCAGGLAASMSTGDALVHGAAAIAVEDVYVGASRAQLSQHRQRTLIRWSAVGVGVVGYIVALATSRSLVGLLLMAYGAVVQLAPSVYGAFLWRRATGAGAVAGLIVGVSITGLLVMRPDWRPYGLHEGLTGLIANLVTFIVVSLGTSAPDPRHVDDWMATTRRET